MTHRLYGSLNNLTDSERRPLRPIGMTVHEVATRTGNLLAGLVNAPGVRLFAGVRVSAQLPPITFAVSAGRRLLLVEPVAWPRGAYTTTPSGGVLCDGTYIGQSVHPLIGSVRRLRRVLRHGRVAAVVVVFPTGGGTPSLPDTKSPELAWLSPGEVQSHIALGLRRRRPPETSCHYDSISWYHRPSTSRRC